MLKKYTEIEFSNKTFEDARKWIDNNATFQKALNGEKYLFIDWRDADIDDVKNKLSLVDKDVINAYIDTDLDKMHVNNKEVLFEMIKYCDPKDPPLLWIYLVDNERIMSTKLYESNTDKENFDILMKFTKFILPL